MCAHETSSAFYKSRSTVDWCERNYHYSPYIAEFWNTISSLVLFYAGFVGYKNHSQLKGSSVFFILAIVGLGSALFHGSLSAATQMSDEIPMIFLVLQISLNVIKAIKIHTIIGYFTAIAFSSFVCHMAFLEDVHHIQPITENNGVATGIKRWQFYLFQSFIIVYSTYIFYIMCCNALKNTQTKKLFIEGSTFFLLGWMCWLLDYFYCETWESSVNIQLHAWWHVLSSIGVYRLSLLSIILCNGEVSFDCKGRVFGFLCKKKTV